MAWTEKQADLWDDFSSVFKKLEFQSLQDICLKNIFLLLQEILSSLF